MAVFGTENQADRQRAERVTAWVRGRTPWALGGLLLGVVSVLDAVTVVLGLAAGAGAMFCGYRGLRDLQTRPHLRGRGLCRAALALGAGGMVLSVVWVAVIYPMIARAQAG